jgi:hypothetical protein
LYWFCFDKHWVLYFSEQSGSWGVVASKRVTRVVFG